MKGVWGKPCFPQGGLGVYPQSVRKRAPGVLRGVTPLKRLQGASPIKSARQHANGKKVVATARKRQKGGSKTKPS